MQECRDFFDSPLSNKEEHPMSGEYPYGYSGLQGEIAGGSYEYGAADQKESFAVCLGPEEGADARMPTPRWPSEPAHFKASVTAYYREMETLARVLLRIFALALELPEDYFNPFEDKHWSALRCLNYPHSDKPFAPGQMRIAAHTDYGTLTILRADNTPGGLQLQMKDGSWRDVFIPPECFTINLGDLMQRWTNDLWKSTVHRVVPPPVTMVRVVERQRKWLEVGRPRVRARAPVCDTAAPANTRGHAGAASIKRALALVELRV